MLERLWRKGNARTLLVGMKIGMATMENSMKFPQKIKNKVRHDPTGPFLGIYPDVAIFEEIYVFSVH